MDTTAAMVIKDQQNLPPPPSKYDILKSFLSLNVNYCRELMEENQVMVLAMMKTATQDLAQDSPAPAW